MTCCTTSHIQLLGDYRRWLQAANCSPRTVGARLDGARRLLCAADHQPSLITRDHVLAFITSVDAAWSRVTYYQHAATFHAFLTARGDSPGFMQGVPKSRARRGVPRPADPQKVALAILAARRKPAMMLLLATFAGLRVSEIAVVRGEDVGPSIYVHGKGGRTDMLPTHPRITEAAEAFPRSGYWFPNAIGEPITRISVWRHMSEALRAVGSTDTPHQCRHLYGTALLESGADLRTVQKLLRHASLATTEIYTEVTDVRLRAAILGLPELV